MASRTDAKPPKSEKEKAKEREKREKARAEAAAAAAAAMPEEVTEAADFNEALAAAGLVPPPAPAANGAQLVAVVFRHRAEFLLPRDTTPYVLGQEGSLSKAGLLCERPNATGGEGLTLSCFVACRHRRCDGDGRASAAAAASRRGGGAGRG